MLKKFKTVFKIIEWVLFVILLCLLFIVISPKLPIKNLPKSFVVVSGSMEPTIKTGSVAFTREVDSKTIKAGDIVAFTSPSDSKDTILHRVNSISSTNPLFFKTKGDNNNDIDTWDVMDVGVKGLYFGAIPYLGYIGAFVKKPLGFGLIIGLPAFLFIISQLFNIKIAISEEVDRKVAQKLKESESKKSKNTTLKSILFFLLFSAGIFGLNHLNTAKALYSDSVAISGVALTVADFTKPSVPVLISPIGFTNDTTPLMQWEDSTYYQENVTIGYRYRVKYNCTNIDNPDTCSTVFPNNTGLWLNSSQYQAGITNNGVYYWQVQACLTTDNCSDWSSYERVTLDSNIPSSVITLPLDSSQNNNPSLSIISFWDGNITGTATDNFTGVDHVELSIYSSDSNKYWNGFAWIDGTELTTRVTAQGTNNWSYQIATASLFNGTFKIVSHAVDNAGNVENSATIEFEYNSNYVQIVSPIVTSTIISIPTLTTDINLLSNHSGNKINLEINNISSPLDYEILYTGNGIEKGIFGHINSDEIINSKYSKDFYLGTCSTGGNCTSESIEIGSAITVNLTGGITLIKTFNY